MFSSSWCAVSDIFTYLFKQIDETTEYTNVSANITTANGRVDMEGCYPSMI